MEQKKKRNSKELAGKPGKEKKRNSADKVKSFRQAKSKKVVKKKTKSKTKKSKTQKKKSPSEKQKKKSKTEKSKIVRKEKEKDFMKDESSSSSDDDDDEANDPFSTLDLKQMYMAGKIRKKRQEPTDYVSRMLNTERPDLFPMGVTLEPNEAQILDDYLKAKGELRCGEVVVMKESENDNDTKTQDRLKILNKYSEGRFGAIYAVQRVASTGDKVVFAGNEIMSMKTSLRQSSASSNRLVREIVALKLLMNVGKGQTMMKRIVPLLFESKVLGIPYFIMPPMGPNLDKLRLDYGVQVTVPCAFFIAQEILMGVKDVHSRKLIHRDIKPSNIVVHPTCKTQWWLIDFGDAVGPNQKFPLSPPDAHTLPYLSLTGHFAAMDLTPANYRQDVESWFYILMDMIKPLAWKSMIEEEDVLVAKKDFWAKGSNDMNEYPSQILQLRDLIAKGVEYPYKEFSILLKDGFEKHKPAVWKPSWMPQEQPPVQTPQIVVTPPLQKK